MVAAVLLTVAGVAWLILGYTVPGWPCSLHAAVRADGGERHLVHLGGGRPVRGGRRGHAGTPSEAARDARDPRRDRVVGRRRALRGVRGVRVAAAHGVPVRPAELDPPYWVSMGAVAITAVTAWIIAFGGMIKSRLRIRRGRTHDSAAHQTTSWRVATPEHMSPGTSRWSWAPASSPSGPVSAAGTPGRPAAVPHRPRVRRAGAAQPVGRPVQGPRRRRPEEPRRLFQFFTRCRHQRPRRRARGHGHLTAATVIARGPRRCAGRERDLVLWVVALPPVAIGAGPPEHHATAGTDVLAAVAVISWSVGVVLYVATAVLVMMRLIMLPVEPEDIDPPFWILMGCRRWWWLRAAHRGDDRRRSSTTSAGSSPGCWCP